jgi:hypothetical protein
MGCLVDTKAFAIMRSSRKRVRAKRSFLRARTDTDARAILVSTAMKK